MSRRHALRAAFLAGILAIAACGPLTVTTAGDPEPKASGKGGSANKRSPKPSPSPSAAAPASKAPSVAPSQAPSQAPASVAPSVAPSVATSPAPSVAPSTAPSVVASVAPSVAPSTVPSAAASAVAAASPPPEFATAAAFPFTEVGAVRTYTLLIKAGSITLPGFRKTKVVAVTEASAQVWVSQLVDISKAPLPGVGGSPAEPVEKVLTVPRDGSDPHFFIDNALFELASTSQTTPTWQAEARTVLGAQAEVVRKRFKAEGAAAADLDYGLTAARGLVHAKVVSKKLPASLLPPEAAMLAALGMDLELVLTTDDQYAFATAEPPAATP